MFHFFQKLCWKFILKADNDLTLLVPFLCVVFCVLILLCMVSDSIDHLEFCSSTLSADDCKFFWNFIVKESFSWWKLFISSNVHYYLKKKEDISLKLMILVYLSNYQYGLAGSVLCMYWHDSVLLLHQYNHGSKYLHSFFFYLELCFHCF